MYPIQKSVSKEIVPGNVFVFSFFEKATLKAKEGYQRLLTNGTISPRCRIR